VTKAIKGFREKLELREDKGDLVEILELRSVGLG